MDHHEPYEAILHPRRAGMHALELVAFVGVIAALGLLLYSSAHRPNTPQPPRAPVVTVTPPTMPFTPTPVSWSPGYYTTYHDPLLGAEFSYPAYWTVAAAGDTARIVTVIAPGPTGCDSRCLRFMVQFRRTANLVPALDIYLDQLYATYPHIMYAPYQSPGGIRYTKVTGDNSGAAYTLYTLHEESIYQITVDGHATTAELQEADRMISSFIFQSDIDTYKIKNDLQSLRIALEMYLVDHEGQYPVTLQPLTEEGYLPTLPQNPDARYPYDYEPHNGTTPTYTITTTLPDGSLYTVINP